VSTYHGQSGLKPTDTCGNWIDSIVRPTTRPDTPTLKGKLPPRLAPDSLPLMGSVANDLVRLSRKS
jgi:hypothetical protein